MFVKRMFAGICIAVLPMAVGFQLLGAPSGEASLADAIARLLKNPELRANLGKAGRATVDAYSWETVAKRIFNYYIECAEQIHATRGVQINDDSHMATSSNPSIR